MNDNQTPMFDVHGHRGRIELRVGDEIGYYRATRFGRQVVDHGTAKVRKVSKTRVTLDNGKVFKPNGIEWGQTYEFGLQLIDAGLLAKRVADQLDEEEQRSKAFALSEWVESRFRAGFYPFLTAAEKGHLRRLVEAVCSGQPTRGQLK